MMDISAGQNNSRARHGLTRQILGQLSASEATEALFNQHGEHKDKYLWTDVMAWSKRVFDERGRGEHQTLMERFGLSTLNRLTPDMYRSFLEYAKCIIWYGISPAYAWHNSSDVPYDLRDRWLLYHPESDDLFELHTMAEVNATLANGELNDVSGIELYEEAFLRGLSPDELRLNGNNKEY